MRIVVALGGNALLRRGEPMTPSAQRENVRLAARALAPLAMEHELVVTHGNGPQVGLLALQAAAYARSQADDDPGLASPVESVPLDVLGAQTEGAIGYMIEQELGNLLPFEKPLATILTMIEVAPDDPAFENPTKPIGHELPTTSYERLQTIGVPVAIDSAGRRRRLAASPVPVDVVEAAAVKRLVEEGRIVIASGGGGPPVYLHHSRGWEGVEAVVDKDRVAAVLGKRLNADTLLILTNVDAVYRDWGTDAAVPISRLSVTEARELVAGGGLGVGSMTPKLEAAADFVESGGRRAIIAHLDAGLEAIQLGTGTHIIGEIE